MGEAAAPAWVDDVVGALPGVEELLPAPYWEHSDLHGADSLMHTMHAGPAPALRGVRIFLQRSQRRIHGVWLLGANVCSHPGVGHGAITMLAMDETLGTMFHTMLSHQLGPGFTVNLQVDFRKPVAAGSTLYVVGELQEVVGRKVKLKGTVRDAPDGTVLLEASALFVTPKKQ